ncbi:NAD(P)-binding protein [Aaosphaeria arxii CBS 175.79]|uniref:NAD(P)-binding protein n=1 Tax=Aaosphaeria arxii CBS 175.79 TaxID=1450172 RepID=A0A6A5Y091_9PLEO|nr:NAD(P)-binding protein [Aaosphaeria arxii CBS 175.79]KAF2018646.1 NAD(P)-binding protein [Aaosphaeria arxii CBS 175.79]
MPTPRHALITGGSRGIGLAIAQLFASQGYRLTLLARNNRNLEDALSTLPTSHLSSSSPHRYIATHAITNDKFWTTSGLDDTFGAQYEFEDAKEKNIDVLVNCAGISQSSSFVRTKGEDIKEIVDINLTAAMLATRFLLSKRYIKGRSFKAAETEEPFSPTIINVASLLGMKGGVGAVAYAASKAGMIGFTRALAAEIGRSGIRVNTIVPGYVSTDMTTDLERSSDLRSSIPMGRFGKPEEIADAALFLARNQYAHNCILNLDGGLSAT